MQKIHYEASWGLKSETACGKSTHTYVAFNKVQNVTTEKRNVTCANCIKKMGR